MTARQSRSRCRRQENINGNFANAFPNAPAPPASIALPPLTLLDVLGAPPPPQDAWPEQVNNPPPQLSPEELAPPPQAAQPRRHTCCQRILVEQYHTHLHNLMGCIEGVTFPRDQTFSRVQLESITAPQHTTINLQIMIQSGIEQFGTEVAR